MDISETTIVAVPGAWHYPNVFENVFQLLQQRGYATSGVSLPSVGAEPPTKDGEDDVKAIRASIEAASEDGGDVLVVAHSYGGVPAGSSIRELDKKYRSSIGKAGGVIGFVYLASYPMLVGQTMTSVSDPTSYEGRLIFDDGRLLIDEVDAEILFKGKIGERSLEERPAKSGKYIPHHCVASSYTPASFEPWQVVPCTYVVAERDLVFPPDAQREVAKNITDCFMESCETSHSLILDDPIRVAEIIDAAVQRAKIS